MADTEDDFDSLYGSKYLSVADLKDREPKLVIGKVEVVELREKNGAAKLKRVVWFNGATKALVVNKTNAKKLADVYGKKASDWIGQCVELYAEDTTFGKGVRVRPLRKPTPPGGTDPALNDAVPF